MSEQILIGLLVILTLVPVALQNTYSNLPLKELKRRAAGGDIMAQSLHNASVFGGSLYLLLWGIAGLSSAIFMFVVVRNLTTWSALASILALMAIGFGWLPRSHPGPISRQLTRWLTPGLVWLLNYFHPVASRLGGLGNLHNAKSQHLDIYEKQDLLDVLEEQKNTTHNRIEKQELDLAIQALDFGEKIIRDYMTPLRRARTVLAKDAAGPVLIDELHKTGQTSFPVVEGKGKVVGTLFLSDLMGLIKSPSAGAVREVMKDKVYYVHEDQPLSAVLQAEHKTGQQFFVVVNNFKDSVGVITGQEVTDQLLSESVDDFDQYDDIEAVINHAKEPVESLMEEPEPAELEAEPAEDEEVAEPESTEEKAEPDESTDTEEPTESPEPESEDIGETEEPETKTNKPKPSKIKEEHIDETIEVD